MKNIPVLYFSCFRTTSISLPRFIERKTSNEYEIKCMFFVENVCNYGMFQVFTFIMF